MYVMLEFVIRENQGNVCQLSANYPASRRLCWSGWRALANSDKLFPNLPKPCCKMQTSNEINNTEKYCRDICTLVLRCFMEKFLSKVKSLRCH